MMFLAGKHPLPRSSVIIYERAEPADSNDCQSGPAGRSQMKVISVVILVASLLVFVRAAAAADQDAQFYFDRGNSHLNEGDYAKAIESYSRVISIYPGFDQAYFNRGLAYDKNGQYEEAVSDFTKVISVHPENAELYSNRALAYLKLKQYENAIEDYNKVVALSPDSADAYHNRGIAYAHMGKYDKAMSDYNKALDIRPDDGNIYASRGVSYVKKAMEDFRRACDAGIRYACDNLAQLSK
jgi:tetratricopeptide (TPR) repeat protein